MGDGLVADAQAIAGLPGERMIVVGIGVEVWQLHRRP